MSPTRLRLLTWNVLANAYATEAWYGHIPPERLLPQYRHPRIAERLRRAKADIICLQEVEPDLLRLLRARFAGRRWITLYAPKRPDAPEGLMILVRRTRARLLSAHGLTGLEGAAARPCESESLVAATLAVNAPAGPQPLSIVNAHLPYDGPANEVGHRGFAIAGRLLGALDPSHPTIICGDLNSEPGWATEALIRAHGFTDLHAEPAPVATWRNRDRRQRLDYFFAGPGVTGRERPVEALPAEDLPTAEVPSDHVPLEAVVDVG